MSGHGRHPIVTAEGQPTGQQLVQHDSPRVDVAAGVATVALYLFRRHVVGSSEPFGQVSPGKSLRAFESRGTEVNDLQVAVLRDDQVFGLEVTVYDAVLVEVHEHRCELSSPVERGVDGDRTVEALEMVAEVLAIEELEHQIRLTAVFAAIGSMDKTRMIEGAS